MLIMVSIWYFINKVIQKVSDTCKQIKFVETIKSTKMFNQLLEDISF